MNAREQFDQKAAAAGKALAQLVIRLRREKAEKRAAGKSKQEQGPKG